MDVGGTNMIARIINSLAIGTLCTAFVIVFGIGLFTTINIIEKIRFIRKEKEDE